MRRFFLAALTLSLAACAGGKPSHLNSQMGVEGGIKEYRAGVDMVTPQNETPVILVADYRHVLTTNPAPEYAGENPGLKTKETIDPQEETGEPKVEHHHCDRVAEAHGMKSVTEATANGCKGCGNQKAAEAVSVSEQDIKEKSHGKHLGEMKKFAQLKVSQTANDAISSTPKESAETRAWRRYCDNGRGMTDEDIEIITSGKFQIPEEFQKDCFPPK